MNTSDLKPFLIFLEEIEGLNGMISLVSFPTMELLSQLRIERTQAEMSFRLTESLALEFIYFESELLINTTDSVVRDTIFSISDVNGCVICSVMTARDDSDVCSSFCHSELLKNPYDKPFYEIEEIEELDPNQWIHDELNRVKLDLSFYRRKSIKLHPSEKQAKLGYLMTRATELTKLLEVTI